MVRAADPKPIAAHRAAATSPNPVVLSPHLAAPFARVVWFDADVMIHRNIDELCETGADRPGASDAPPSGGSQGSRGWRRADFAAALNHGHEPRTCWSEPEQSPSRLEVCARCVHHGVQRLELKGSFWVSGAIAATAGANALPPRLPERGKSRGQRSIEVPAARGRTFVNRSGLPPCRYNFNTGVMVVAPLPPARFEAEVLRAVACGHVASSQDGGPEQGKINTFIHSRGLYANRTAVLPLGYNVVHRTQATRPALWKAIKPAITHTVGNPKPWSPWVPQHCRWHVSPRNIWCRQHRAWRDVCKRLIGLGGSQGQ